MNKIKNIIVTDITLPTIDKYGLNLTFRDKLKIADILCKMNIDRICLPILRNESNVRENVIVYKTIAEAVKNASVVMSGDSKETLDVAYECIKNTENPCLRVILPTSTVQMEYLYHKKAPAMKEYIKALCAYAKTLCDNVEFVMADATRAEDGFVCECAKAAVENGALIITVCDDGGVFTPCDYKTMINDLKSVCGDETEIFIQPSDLFGLAYASLLKAVSQGASGVVCVSTENEFEYAKYAFVKTSRFADLFKAKIENKDMAISLDTATIHTLSDKITDIVNQKNTSNEVFESNEKKEHNNTVSFNESSSYTDIINAVKELGYTLSDDDSGKVFEEFRRVIAKKEKIGTRELEAIIASSAMQVPSTYHLDNYVVNSGTLLTATANVTLIKDGVKYSGVSVGDGPIDAAFHAIEQIVGHRYELDDFSISAITKGREAVGSSLIRLRNMGRLYAGNGVSTDIIGACIRAYINALNKIVFEENQ